MGAGGINCREYCRSEMTTFVRTFDNLEMNFAVKLATHKGFQSRYLGEGFLGRLQKSPASSRKILKFNEFCNQSEMF